MWRGMVRVLWVVLLVGCSTSATVKPTTDDRGYDLEPVDDLGLFSDEEAQSVAILRRALQERGVRLASRAELATAWELALESRSPFTRDTCGMSLGREVARRRWGDELGVDGLITSRVSCLGDAGCTLTVSAAKLSDAEEGLSLVAPISASGPPLQALEQAVTRLEVPAPLNGTSETEVHGVFGALATVPEPPLRTVDRLEVRVWAPDVRDTRPLLDVTEDNAFGGLVAADVVKCLSIEQNSIQLLLEVGGDGALTRCEGRTRHEACMCDRLKTTTVNGALSNRRWAASLNVQRKDLLSDDGRLVLHAAWNTRIEPYGPTKEGGTPLFRAKVSDPSIEEWQPGPGRLVATCFGSAFTGPGKLVSRWDVTFDADGVATRAAPVLGGPVMAPAVVSCISKTLLTARAPCPRKKSTRATAELLVEASEVKKDEPTLVK